MNLMDLAWIQSNSYTYYTHTYQDRKHYCNDNDVILDEVSNSLVNYEANVIKPAHYILISRNNKDGEGRII